MGDDIYLLGSSSPLVVSIILSVCPSLINRCPPWATKLLTNPTLACRHFSLHMNVAVEVIWSGSATGGLCTHMTWYQITVHLDVVTSPYKRHRLVFVNTLSFWFVNDNVQAKSRLNSLSYRNLSSHLVLPSLTPCSSSRCTVVWWIESRCPRPPWLRPGLANTEP